MLRPEIADFIILPMITFHRSPVLGSAVAELWEG